jgi:N-acyl-D-amino-acid deacylase
MAAVSYAPRAEEAGRASTSVDLLIRDGTVFDGESTSGVAADVGIRGDAVAFIGNAAATHLKARRTIDAKGLIVAPGFIDVHVHTDRDLLSDDAKRRLTLSDLAQGVTTNVIGVDGGGEPEVAEVFARAKRLGIGTNFATYVGFGAIRTRVLGEAAREPTTAELDQMKRLVAQGMCGGAIGFSTGLFYAPQSYAHTEEVIALAREAARYGGIYDSHQRDESSGGPGSIGIENSVREFLRISKEAGLPGHLAHIKNSGVFSWGKSSNIIALIEAARADGQKITADQYPYLASSGNIASILLPRWALEGGRPATLARLHDPDTAARLRTEIAKFLAGRGGGKNLRITSGGSNWLGKSLADLAALWHLDEVDAAIRIYEEGDANLAVFTINPDDVRAYMVRSWVMSSSDGTEGHPRKYGTFATLYDTYVVKEQVLTLAEFVHRSTALSADSLGLTGRGRLKVGRHADVIVFDPAHFAPLATYEQPDRLAVGMVDVMVNGQLAFENGHATGVLAGRGLLHQPPPGSCSRGPRN